MRRLLAWLMVLTGSGLIAWELIREAGRLQRQPLPLPTSLPTALPLERLERWRWRLREGTLLTFQVAHFRDRAGRLHRALWPENPEAWVRLVSRLRQLEDGVLLSWWPHAERLLLFSGRSPPCPLPPREAFSEEMWPVWRPLLGRSPPESCLKPLARWLTLPFRQALAEIGDRFGAGPVYLLVSTEELLHLEEIERLAGRRLPVEIGRLPPISNPHAQIRAAKRWGLEGGRRYLPVKVPGGIVLFRTSEAGGRREQPLLFRLLPFLPPERPPLPLLFETEDHTLRLYRLP